MIFPHALFAGTCIIFKLLFPSSITYLARDTLLYFGLSVVYPWICTVALLNQYHHPSTNDDKRETTNKTAEAAAAIEKDGETTISVGSSSATSLQEKRRAINARYKAPSSTSSSYKPTASSQRSSSSSSSVPAKKHDYLRRRTNNSVSDNNNNLKKIAKTNNSSSLKSGSTPSSKFKNNSNSKKNDTKTHSKEKQSAVQLFLAARRRHNGDGDGDDNSLQAEASFWLQYWIIYSIVTGVGRMIYLLPIVGRIVIKSTWLSALIVELQLLWIVWIYGLEWALASSSTNESDWKRSCKVRPLPFLTHKLIPPITRWYEGISLEVITAETWNTTICKKASSFLDLAVMMRLLSESTTKQILNVMQYAHPFLIPGMTLMMPGFITEYGVIYVKTIVPSAKTFLADKKTKTKKSFSFASLSLKDTMKSLQYWVLQALLSAFLSWWSGILWWIPFSTHAIFCLWCRLQYSSDAWYHTLEMELSAFGLLPPLSNGDGDQPLQIKDTMTLKVLSRVIQALPSAKTTALSLNDSKIREEKDEDMNNDNEGEAETSTDDVSPDSSKEKSIDVIPPPSSAFKHAQTNHVALSTAKDETVDDTVDETVDEVINKTETSPDSSKVKTKTKVNSLVQSLETPTSKKKEGDGKCNNDSSSSSSLDKKDESLHVVPNDINNNVNSGNDTIINTIITGNESEKSEKDDSQDYDHNNDHHDETVVVSEQKEKVLDNEEIITSSRQMRRSERLRCNQQQ